LTQFQNCLRALAARSGNSSISATCRAISASRQYGQGMAFGAGGELWVVVVRPYYANIGKRLVKAPKVYFTDTGTLSFLTGLRDPEHAALGPLGGSLFETAVLAEIMRTYWHWGEEPRVHFWRTSAGSEVDFVVEHGAGLIPIEVKLSARPRPGIAASIGRLQEDLGEIVRPGYVVHQGDAEWPLGPRVKASRSRGCGLIVSRGEAGWGRRFPKLCGTGQAVPYGPRGLPRGLAGRYKPVPCGF